MTAIGALAGAEEAYAASVRQMSEAPWTGPLCLLRGGRLVPLVKVAPN